MFSILSSLLPTSFPLPLPTISLPSFTLPTSIQRRFVAFLLQKTIGHFVKPGQLDSTQVDAQLGLGNGVVKLEEVLLDEEGINASLRALPIRLHSGRLGSVAVSFPIQSILTAPVTVEVERLELRFSLLNQSTSGQESGQEEPSEEEDPLMHSVMSVAQEFIHEELEVESLRESVMLQREGQIPRHEHPRSGRFLDEEDDDVATHVPGSFDPFTDPFQVEAKKGLDRSSSPSGLDDVEGVSILAGVIERILARLSVSVREITVVIVHEGNAELVLKIGEIGYGTEEVIGAEGDGRNSATSTEVGGIRRTVRVQGVDIFLKSLARPTLALPISPSTVSEAQLSPAEPIRIPQTASSPIQSLRLVETPAPRNETLSPNALSLQTPLSSHDSDGDVEEEEEDEMDASMTQSMLSLPPPGVIASTILSEHGSDGSPSSTMYLSAAGSVRAHTPPALTLQELDNPLLASSSPDADSDSPVTPTYTTTALPASNLASSSPINGSTDSSHIDRFPAPNPLISNTTSTPAPAHETRSPEVPKQEVPSYHILSFGKDPILISLMTPPPTGAKGPSTGTTAAGTGGATGLDPGVSSPSRPSTMGKGRKEYKGIMILSVKLGVLAVAMDVEHVNALMSIGDAVTPKTKEKKTPKPKKLFPSSSPAPSLLDEIEGSFSLRAVHVFLFDTSLSPSKGILNVKTQPSSSRDAQEERMNVGRVMWNDILSQPMSIMIKEGHIRAHLDTLSLKFALDDDGKRKITGGIKDLSVFWIGGGVTVVSHPAPPLKEDSPNEIDASRDNDGVNKEQWLASPVLIIDHHLASQYDPVSIDIRESPSPHSIPVTDWTNPSSHTSSPGRPKISLWRAKPLPHKNDRDYSHGLGKPTASEDLEAAIWQIELHTGVSSIEIAPLHFFVDTRMLQWFLGLVQRIQLPASSPTGTPGYPATEYDHPYVETTPHPRGGRGWMASSVPENAGYLPRAPRSPVRTPRTQVVELSPLSADQEKQRLRDFVLSDIEMATHRQNTGDESGLHVRCAVIRCEVRCGPTTPYPRLTKRKLPRQRSGAIILDIHHPHVALPNSAVGEARKNPSLPHGPNVERKLQFVPYGLDGEEGDYHELPLKTRFEWNDILAFYAVPVATKATPFLRIGEPSQTQHMQDAMETQVEQSMRPTALMRSGTLISQQNQSMSSAPPSMTLVEVAIPTIVTTIDKLILGGLQLWSDDMAQWAEKVAGLTTSTAASQTTSRAQSVLIGSRYFVRRTASNVGEEPESPTYSEFSVKVNITEAKIRLRMPTQGDLVRNVDVIASNINIGIEVKPGGRDETAILARIMDITLQDTHSNQTKVLFALALPRRLFASSSPMISLRLDSLSLPDSKSKQSRIHLTTSNFTFSIYPEFDLIEDLARFVKAPPGVFEQVIPTERTVLDVNIKDGSIRVIPPNHLGCLVLNLEDVSFGTDIVANSTESSVAILARLAHVLLVDDQEAPVPEALQTGEVNRGFDHWLKLGYARLLDAANFHVRTVYIAGDIPRTRVDISDAIASIRLCADTIPTLAALIGDLATLIPKEETNPTIGVTAVQSSSDQSQASMSMIMETNAYKQPPVVGPEPDMVEDDLPKNPDYLDASYGAAAGARPIEDEDLEDPDSEDEYAGRRTPTPGDPSFVGIISTYGKETIKMLTGEGLKIIEGYFDRLPPVEHVLSSNRRDALTSLRITGTRVELHLHSGYDWHRTRKAIEEEVKSIRRRLEKIRQLLANGQTPDDSIEKTDALLFNSVYLGLDTDIEDLEGQELVAAIDANLADDFETASQDSWQTMPSGVPQQPRDTKRRRKRSWRRSTKSEVEIQVQGLNAEVNKFGAEETISSHILARIRDLKILDHMKTSTWEKFLTSMRKDSRGNKRETESDMVRLELQMVKPAPSIPHEEARLKAKILPIQLYVDQDALDFLKKFFAFQDVNGFQPPVPPQPQPETYFQRVEIFPVELKLDYKPKRVDYKALKEGRTIELMNFFHFENAEMTLRHITLNGIQGWARVGDTLNDLWTPDVKANQLADVISGVAPIRSLVNVGTGLADLVLLPIAQYKKDKRLVRGVQKGTAAFMKTTAMETIRLGARLATGTQVILEHAERALGADHGLLDDGRAPGVHGRTIMTETIPSPTIRAMSTFGGSDVEGLGDGFKDPEEVDQQAVISRYAAQPEDVREGVKTAYKSLSRNLNAAAQTILAVPMEVYEQSGSGGPVRAVVRAVPIAVIKPMIGASEAVRETLLGLRNTLDPDIIQANEDKYKGVASP